MRIKLFPLMLALSLLTLTSATSASAAELAWSFGEAGGTGSQTRVNPTSAFSESAGYGFESVEGITSGSTGHGAEAAGYCTSNKEFSFSAVVPEGNYDVAVTLFGVEGSKATIKAETRRLMVESATPPVGKTQTLHFTVNVRRPEIAGGDRVHLKTRELNSRTWDDKLTLQFSGSHPCVSEIEIKPVTDAVTVYLAGDSTVTDQSGSPYSSWGQMLPRFLKPGVAVANYAESGLALKSFIAENRLAKIQSVIESGDYLFVQFGHNDQKDKSADAGAYKSYTVLLKKMVAAARDAGAQPVLVTPVSRRSFKGDKIVSNLGDFPQAVRDVAKSEGVPLIDLNAQSIAFYEALGPQESGKAFALTDHTHHNDYGSYELAKCIVTGIIADKLGVAKFVVDDWKTFDPAHPDPVDQFDLPPDPAPGPTTKPEGN
jgi:lysophospholipase L1-like esterase